ncbi:hypothetical protein C8F01DRAFT_1228955 [Mycena amicta]|nr:hypothetical protein C8F01DRAFT_1228955 [Mycena amicta]
MPSTRASTAGISHRVLQASLVARDSHTCSHPPRRLRPHSASTHSLGLTLPSLPYLFASSNNTVTLGPGDPTIHSHGLAPRSSTFKSWLLGAHGPVPPSWLTDALPTSPTPSSRPQARDDPRALLACMCEDRAYPAWVDGQTEARKQGRRNDMDVDVAYLRYRDLHTHTSLGLRISYPHWPTSFLRLWTVPSLPSCPSPSFTACRKSIPNARCTSGASLARRCGILGCHSPTRRATTPARTSTSPPIRNRLRRAASARGNASADPEANGRAREDVVAADGRACGPRGDSGRRADGGRVDGRGVLPIAEEVQEMRKTVGNGEGNKEGGVRM